MPTLKAVPDDKVYGGQGSQGVRHTGQTSLFLRLLFPVRTEAAMMNMAKPSGPHKAPQLSHPLGREEEETCRQESQKPHS